jgi:hypothetical protein
MIGVAAAGSRGASTSFQLSIVNDEAIEPVTFTVADPTVIA